MSSKKSSIKKTAKTVAKKPVKKTAAKSAAKKAVKKSTVKKTAKKTEKKSTKKTSAKDKKVSLKLVQAKDMKCFWVNQGPILKNLLELEVALEKMSDEMFGRHVSKNRNDFAEWVEHVLMDSETADALRKAKKPTTARKVVVRQLKLYKLPK